MDKMKPKTANISIIFLLKPQNKDDNGDGVLEDKKKKCCCCRCCYIYFNTCLCEISNCEFN